jgi:hypothetical protein
MWRLTVDTRSFATIFRASGLPGHRGFMLQIVVGR